MRKRNPIAGTVKHFLPAGKLRALEGRRKKTPKKSNFVRFFESLENRGPLTMHEDLHAKWTKEVRRQMTKEGTWPIGQAEVDVKIIAEYLSRLQKCFWREYPSLRWYNWTKDGFLDKHFNVLRLKRPIFRRIYEKIRTKGRRDGTFDLLAWRPENIVVAFVGKPFTRNYIRIEPYTPFCDHGGGI